MPNGIWIAAGLIVLLLTSFEAGFRLGVRAAAKHDAPGGGQVGAIQGATLGLLALLLGFSFSGAAARFMERQDLIVREANAIGTAFLRADMLDEPYRTRLRELLHRYVQYRLEVSNRLRDAVSSADAAQIAEQQNQIWKAASEGVIAKPGTMVAVLPPVNEVIDLHTSRIAAGRKHLPGLVMTLLVVCSIVSVVAIGYGCGLTRRRGFPMTGALAILIGAALWTTIDLDHPRAGLIRVDDSPLRELNLISASPK